MWVPCPSYRIVRGAGPVGGAGVPTRRACLGGGEMANINVSVEWGEA